jgi:hypothetical protein
MAGRIIDSARFYKLSVPLLKVGDEGVDIFLNKAKSGFEIIVVRGVVRSMPEQPYNLPSLGEDKKRAYPYATLEKARKAFTRRRKTLIAAGLLADIFGPSPH